MAEPTQILTETATDIAHDADQLVDKITSFAAQAGDAMMQAEGAGGGSSFLIMGLTVFVLACFVGYYVVWHVTPALHSPLMGVTNAISSVIIVGAIIALGSAESGFSQFVGFMAVILASVNIFGGFIVSRRMLSMFKKKG